MASSGAWSPSIAGKPCPPWAVLRQGGLLPGLGQPSWSSHPFWGSETRVNCWAYGWWPCGEETASLLLRGAIERNVRDIGTCFSVSLAVGSTTYCPRQELKNIGQAAEAQASVFCLSWSVETSPYPLPPLGRFIRPLRGLKNGCSVSFLKGLRETCFLLPTR